MLIYSILGIGGYDVLFLAIITVFRNFVLYAVYKYMLRNKSNINFFQVTPSELPVTNDGFLIKKIMYEKFIVVW